MGRSKGIAACQNNSGPSPAVFGFRISGSAGLRSARLCGSLALDALATADAHDPAVLKRGLSWRLQATRDGTHFPPSAIGLYYSKLWYSEALYPIIFSAPAFARLAGKLG